ncbi:hypothetical protein NX779_01635 [Mycoplasma cottewii]|uniref:Uncharacterized protein n=1 Tax=Mycoplasma cottewii TaxID=51364 RepID=A0ABY5TYP9_9MOLU|nr:hypothetical protein [Mycoplasma cottewii]UWD35320.1 hypothetical protein NX779_01635 [Mycoplasma cottewii]
MSGLTRNNFDLVGDATNNSLTIKVKDSDEFQGQITINFKVKEFISNDGVNVNAGPFNAKNVDEIINAFIRNNQDKFPGLTRDDLIVEQSSNNSITVKVRENNSDYQGQAVINYSIRTQINTIQANTNTGAFNSANTNEIIDAFIKNNQDKLPGLTRSNFEIIGNVNNNSMTIRVKNSDDFQGQIEINFTIKINISNNTNKDAGSFNNKNNDDIINAFIRNNPQLNGLTRNDLSVDSESDNSITIKVANDNEKFQGKVTIHFIVRAQIGQVESINVNAGVFNDVDKDDIINTFIRNNRNRLPGMTFNNFKLVHENANSLLVEVKDSDKFQGQIEIQFRIKQFIANVVKNPNAGIFNSKDHDAIINAFIAKNPALAGFNRNQFEVSESKDRSMTIRVKDNDKYKGEITINFTIKAQIDKITTNTDAGSFNTINVEQIIRAFIDKNKDKDSSLSINDFDVVGDATNNSITLRVRRQNQKYQGEVTINFRIRTQIGEVQNIEVNAGVFNSNEENAIIQAFINNNKEILSGLKVGDFKVIGNATNNSVLVKVINSDKFQGEIRIHFTVRTLISDVITDPTKAGAFDSVNVEDIIQAFIKMNKEKIKGLDRNNFRIIEASTQNNWIRIGVVNSDEFQGEITINYTIRQQISTMASYTDAGTFDSKDTTKIVSEFIRLNHHILFGHDSKNFSIVQTTNNSVTLEVINSDKFQGKIEVQFQIKTNISQVDMDTHVGTLDSSSEDEALNRFIAINATKLPGINRLNLRVVNSSDTAVVVEVIDSSRFQGKFTITYGIKSRKTEVVAGSTVGATVGGAGTAGSIFATLRRRRRK